LKDFCKFLFKQIATYFVKGAVLLPHLFFKFYVFTQLFLYIAFFMSEKMKNTVKIVDYFSSLYLFLKFSIIYILANLLFNIKKNGSTRFTAMFQLASRHIY